MAKKNKVVTVIATIKDGMAIDHSHGIGSLVGGGEIKHLSTSTFVDKNGNPCVAVTLVAET